MPLAVYWLTFLPAYGFERGALAPGGFIELHRDRYLEELGQLLAIPSVSALSTIVATSMRVPAIGQLRVWTR